MMPLKIDIIFSKYGCDVTHYDDVINSKLVFLKKIAEHQTPCQIWCSNDLVSELHSG